MKAVPDDISIRDILSLKTQQMLVVNPEYQRGPVWTPTQKKKLVDSVLRGYPIPLMYLHQIRQVAGKLVSERYEVIDGQQRINALADFAEGAFKLFDPVKDESEARFPSFIKNEPCPWAAKSFNELEGSLKEAFLDTQLRIVQIETQNPGEARDLFIRLQAGMPLNSQEKRDAWPGQFTDFVLRLGGKPGIARYPGHEFFNVTMRANSTKDRGKFRQLAAQIAMLLISRRADQLAAFPDINASALDDFYYENLDFDPSGSDAERVVEVLDSLKMLLSDRKRPKIVGHEAIHLALLVDSLLGGYTLSWRDKFADAFDAFREGFAKSKLTQDDDRPSEYWLRYGLWTRANSDRGQAIQIRHEFFATKMRDFLRPQPKDPQRAFGPLERELIYYRDKKRCAVCGAQVMWDEAEVHHVDPHSTGGETHLENGALVHKECHPKSQKEVEDFARRWKEQIKQAPSISAEVSLAAANAENNVDAGY
jgi:5-methylcytosine-specific restriction endonuclease McrA